MLYALGLSVSYAVTVVAQHAPAVAPPNFQQVSLNQVLEKRSISTNPVIRNNFPDPCLIPANPQGTGGYYAFATRNIGSTVNVQVAHTDNFTQGSWAILNSTFNPNLRYDAMPNAPAWVAAQPNANVWAPDVSRLPDGSYIMYYAASVASSPSYHCIGVARSSAVNGVKGPYTPDSTPFICPLAQGGAIDPAGFLDVSTGKRYLAYKVDGNSRGNGGPCGNTVAPIHSTPLMLQQVNINDGTTFIGSAVQILDNRGSSDQGIVEAPSLAKGPGSSYFLLFSSGCFFTTNYTVSYAVSQNGVGGPYKRMASPLLQAGQKGFKSPGGASILWQKDPSPSVRKIVFHDGPTGQRVMYAGTATLGGGKITL